MKLEMTCPIYLFYGEEKLLMEEMIDKIAALVVPEDDSWNKEVYHGDEISPDDIVAIAQSSGFMGLKRMIIVFDIPWLKANRKAKSNEEDKSDSSPDISGVDLTELISYAADPNPDTVLILVCSGNVPANSRLLKAVNIGGRAVQFAALKGKTREKWLHEYFHGQGKVPDRGVIPYVSLMSGEGLLSLKSEADKLILYTEGRTKITMQDAENIISRNSLAGVFDLADQMADKQGAEAVMVFRRLCLQGEVPQKLLAMLGTQYRNTLAVKNMLERGFTAREAASRLAINPYVAQKSASQAKCYSNRELSKAIELLLNADIAQKRGQGEMTELMEVAILRICAI